MKPRLTRMTAGLAVGITAAVAAASGAGAYLYSMHHFNALLQAARNTALTEGELIREALEHQMMENDRSLIARMVESFGRQASVANVVLLDRNGVVRFSSAPVGADADLRIGSPTCQACHRYPPAQRGSSRVVEARGGTILRTVVPILNREACHRCHDPSHRINGILIFDRDTGEMRAELNSDVRWMVAGSGGLALLLVVLIALVVRVVVLRRLQRFETTARLIAGGDLDRRVPAGGSDTISWLAREFNTMADSVTGLLTEVRDQRERLETVINSIDDGIVVLDEQRNVVAANDGFLARTGRSRSEVLGFCCRTAGHCTVDDCPTLGCLRSGESQVRICERLAVDGTVAWEEVHASPIRGPSGHIVQVVEVWRDISERRTAEARLAESHRLASLGLLASGYSHELNTPLGTILACLEGILRDLQRAGDGQPEWPRIGEHATIAREQVLRCRAVTQQFLRLSRGQATPSDLIDVQETVTAVARLVEPTARARSVHVDVAAPAPRVRVRADEAELQQALINLLLNAIQACAAGGRVEVAVVDKDARVRIQVSDDGCGIAPEHQQRIFEPFFSLRSGGTGLGLFLSLNFVRAWGGDILVQSVIGGGSTFTIDLPVAPSAGAIAVEAAS
jgi:PAS domain S-box-containing protein